MSERRSSNLAESMALCRRARDHGFRQVLIMVSGGKDSLATLDTIHRSKMFERIECGFLYLVPGLFIEPHIHRIVEKRYKLKLHKWLSPSAISNIKHGKYCPAYVEADGLRSFEEMRNQEKVFRYRTGIDLIAYGWRASDSILRRLETTQTKGLDVKWRRLYPIWDWNTEAVVAYLRRLKLSTPLVAGGRGTAMGSRCNGIGLIPSSLIWIKRNYPNDFEKIKHVFPFIDAVVVREEIRQREIEIQKLSERSTQRAGPVQISEFQSGTGTPQSA